MATAAPENHVTWAGIRLWLPIIVMLAGLLVGAGVFQGQVTAIRTQVDFNTARLDVLQRQSQTQDIMLATMARDLVYIRTAIDKLENVR